MSAIRQLSGMIAFLFSALLSCMLIFQSSSLAAQTRSLQVCEKAPSLTIQKWIKGTPVLSFKKGNIYVVEFSGSWCPPCRKAIPHLTELTKMYDGRITLISVYLENNDPRDSLNLEYVQKVSDFITAMDERVGFTVAVDVPQKISRRDWKIRAIPKAFVVGPAGKIIWIGRPVDLDKVLEDVVNSRFDPLEARQQQDQANKVIEKITELRVQGDAPLALRLIDSLIASNPGKNYLYMHKFAVLAGYDDARAYALVRWMLTKPMPGFDWDHFVWDSYSLPAVPDTMLALQVADRAIAEAETEELAAQLLTQKANIYTSSGNISEAIKTVQQQVNYFKSINDVEQVSELQGIIATLKKPR